MPMCCKNPNDIPANLNGTVVLVEANDTNQSTTGQPSPTSLAPKPNSWWTKFLPCCKRSSEPEDENLLTKRPRMLGKRDLLLSIESIAKINTGRWKFEVESIQEQDKARNMDCIIQLEPNHVDSTEVKRWRERMTNNRWGSLPLNHSYRRRSTFDYRFSLPPSQRRKGQPIDLSSRRLAALKSLSMNNSRLDRAGIEEEPNNPSFLNTNTLYPPSANNPRRGSCHLQTQHSSF